MPSLLFPRQSILDSANDVRNSFSSWDSCMAKAYCKWPVIVAIVVGSLILFSIVSCIVRCCCCGMQCCCSACSCFNACCPSPRRKGYNNHETGPPPQPYNQKQPYGPPAPMNYGHQPQFASPQVDTRPQFATFDSPSGKVHEDSLPAMPSWDNATSRQVELPPEEHEMTPVTNTGSLSPGPLPPGAAAAALSRNSPYRGDGYGAGMGRQSPGAPGMGMGRQSPGAPGMGMGRQSPGAPPGMGMGRQSPGAPPGMGMGRRSPGAPLGMDGHSQAGSYFAGAASVADSDGWGRPQRSDNLHQYGAQGQERGVYGRRGDGGYDHGDGGYDAGAYGGGQQGYAAPPPPQQSRDRGYGGYGGGGGAPPYRSNGGRSPVSPGYGRSEDPLMSAYPAGGNRGYEEPMAEAPSFVNPARPGQFADDHSSRRPVGNGGWRDV